MSEGGLGAPTRHPLDWQNPDFYDEAKLDAETRRVFDICHGCRRCFNLCDSFPRLFDLIDAAPNGELDTVDSQGFKPVVDACTLCDMCFMTKCPYVPPHEFNLDFPHLMLRHRAVEANQGKTKIADRELAKTDRNGKAARFMAPLANWVTGKSNKFMRGIVEKVTGLDKDAELPKYSSKSFEKLSADNPPAVNRDAPAYGRKAVIYATCFPNYNEPRHWTCGARRAGEKRRRNADLASALLRHANAGARQYRGGGESSQDRGPGDASLDRQRLWDHRAGSILCLNVEIRMAADLARRSRHREAVESHLRS